VKVEIDGKQSRREISAMILRKLKEAAELILGTYRFASRHHVPAYFNDCPRRRPSGAAQIAGFEHRVELEDPKTANKTKQRMRSSMSRPAASLAYRTRKEEKRKIAVFEPGWRTFDISILDVGDGVFVG